MIGAKVGEHNVRFVKFERKIYSKLSEHFEVEQSFLFLFTTDYCGYT